MLFPTIHSYSFITDQIMFLIPIVEHYIGGSMSLWPRIILHFLFDFPPTTFSSNALASFLYGKGLDYVIAFRLLRVCHYNAPDEIIQRMRSMYFHWSSNPNVRNVGLYWNMQHRKFVWLNGANGPQFEFLTPGGDNNATFTGFGNKPREWMLRRKLYYIAQTVHL